MKWIEDRSEKHDGGGSLVRSGVRGERRQADGEVLGLRILEPDDVGGSRQARSRFISQKLNNLFNTYNVKHLRLEGRSVMTNKCQWSRTGGSETGMCLSGSASWTASPGKLTLDPVTVRRRELIAVDQFLIDSKRKYHGSGDYQTLLEQGARKRSVTTRSAQSRGENETKTKAG